MKSGVRVLAIASGPIYARRRKRTLIVGIVGRQGTIEGVLSGRVTIDGDDSTRAIAGLVKKSRFRRQIRVIAINGIAIAGLNIVDVKGLEHTTHAPVIVLTRKKPDVPGFMKAISTYAKADAESANRKRALATATNMERGFVKVLGFNVQSAIKASELKAIIPTAFEFLRLAHMIAKGISTGVSSGRV